MKNEKVWLAILLFCLSLPAIAGGLHFGIIDAIKEQKERLKEKIEEGERRKQPEPVEPGYIYVGCFGPYINFDVGYDMKVGIVNRRGKLVKWIGKVGTENGEFGSPPPDVPFFNLLRIAIDKETKDIFVVDPINSRIQRFNENGSFISRFGTYGTASDQFQLPGSITIDDNGVLYIEDSSRIKKFNKNGDFLEELIIFDKVEMTEVKIKGFVFADNYDNCLYCLGMESKPPNDIFIYKLDKKGKILAKFGNGRGTESDQFKAPWGIAVDEEGNIFVSDSRLHRIQKFNKNGEFSMSFQVGPGDGEFRPIDITIDHESTLYVINSWGYHIQKFDNKGRFLENFDLGGDTKWILISIETNF